MAKGSRISTPHRARHVRSRLRPLIISATVAAAIAALLQPIPAMADPASAPGISTVPDTGSRPVQTGTLVLPGTPAARSTPTTPALTTPGVTASPVIQKVEKGRAEIAALGDQLIRVGADRDLAQTQLTTASQRVSETQAALTQAREGAQAAASETIQEAAALPPGSLDSGLLELGALARMQRGDSAPYEAAARRLLAAENAVAAAAADHLNANNRYASLAAQWTALNADLTKKQAAQKKYEDKHRSEITAVESQSTATDQEIGRDILAGSDAGRGADPRAVKALEFALSQRGDPYVWSEEGPDAYDCSGLMYAAYRRPDVGYPLVRVSRDQYYQTRDRTVSRYSLLPGDLLFFSSSSSWTGIHHVAMYAGEGMMVEAPRTGLNVRLTPVRWSRLFAATRVFGSIEGDTEGPDLGSPDPDEPNTPVRPSPSTSSKPPTSGSPSPSSSSSSPAPPKPSNSSSSPTPPKPSTSSSSPAPPSTSPSTGTSTSPSVTPSTSSAPPPAASASASQMSVAPPEPTPTPGKTTASPKPTSTSGGGSSGGGSSGGGSSGSSSSSGGSSSSSSGSSSSSSSSSGSSSSAASSESASKSASADSSTKDD